MNGTVWVVESGSISAGTLRVIGVHAMKETAEVSCEGIMAVAPKVEWKLKQDGRTDRATWTGSKGGVSLTVRMTRHNVTP